MKNTLPNRVQRDSEMVSMGKAFINQGNMKQRQQSQSCPERVMANLTYYVFTTSSLFVVLITSH